MKFGKEIQSNQIPGWSQYYLDYKALKKIISSLESSRSSSVVLSSPLKPGDLFGGCAPVASPPPDARALFGVPSTANEDDRGPTFQAHKTAFFFRLERELEKINAFYLQKEAELKMRLDTLLSKRRAAAQRHESQSIMSEADNGGGVEWRAVEEGFRLLDKDLGKLQQFIDINATGFRKILKKWDKRSKSRTKEMYLASQVEVQPCFNRELLTQLADAVAACLIDPTDISFDTPSVPTATNDMLLTHQMNIRTSTHKSAFRDLETEMTRALALQSEAAVCEVLSVAESLLGQPDAKIHITRILWKAAIEARPSIADIIMASKAYDIHFVDDINGRRCIHGAAIAGELRLVNLCLQSGIPVDTVDLYGRTALHYASMNGYDVICRQLLSLSADPRLLDMDNYNALTYAVINGNVSCVRALLENSLVSIEPLAVTTDLIPLSLACQCGHVEVVKLLLEHGATSIPNTNGEYPLHLAAKEGHVELCKMLVNKNGVGGVDTPDKYNEWTPLFHAARHGHSECLGILLDAHSNPYAIDEFGHTAIFHAAWHGHMACVELLLVQMQQPITENIAMSNSENAKSISPMSDLGPPASEGDGDVIPMLSLPPPIMPFRVYGHSYLDKTYLIQIALGCPFTNLPTINSRTPRNSADLPTNEANRFITQPVELLPGITGLPRQQYQHSRSTQPCPSLRLVITPGSSDQSLSSVAPHTVQLPLVNDKEVFSFQPSSLDNFSLEFSFYPSLGSKPIGRTIVLSSMLQQALVETSAGDGSVPLTLPILDYRLHIIGKVSFEACIVSPFSGVKLEIGGVVETYWKSTSVSQHLTPSGGPSPLRVPPVVPNSLVRSLGLSIIGSNANSPSQRSTTGTGGAIAGGGTVTQSSLTGDYVHIVVQVTRDLVPVVCKRYSLPVAEGFSMGVCDMTSEQFLRLADGNHANLKSLSTSRSATATEWSRFTEKHLLTLEQLLKSLPAHLGISVELGFPTREVRRRYNLGHAPSLNAFVDVILSAVYQASSGGNLPGAGVVPNARTPMLSKRKILFSSFEPNVCIAINWKQPNYPVFFASYCGGIMAQATNEGNLRDKRCTSVGAAVDFAKSNNLLGILVDGELLLRVPALVAAIKDSGILLAAFGNKDQLLSLNASSPNVSMLDGGPTPSISVDAVLCDSVLSYLDHPVRAGAV